MDFKKYDKVYIAADSTSYGGRFAGAVGTVNYCYPGGNKIGVLLQSYHNPNSDHGWFYFHANELRRTSNDQGLTSREDAKRYLNQKYDNPFTIKKAYFNDPVTVVLWADGTKTIVRCGEDDIYDPEKGLAMAISKKALGNKGNYYNTFKKYLPEEEEVDCNLLSEFWSSVFRNLYK